MSGTLYLVATPIGNLEDITLRAIKVLNNADLVLAEDTRNSKKLFAKHLIKTPLSAYHDFSSERKTQSIIKLLKNGKIISLVSDAGTPLISDPGFELVRKAIKENIKIYSIPGPSSVISGLITSGFNNNRFIFEGFLPRKSSDLKKIVTSFKYESRKTTDLYTAPLVPEWQPQRGFLWRLILGWSCSLPRARSSHASLSQFFLCRAHVRGQYSSKPLAKPTARQLY